MTEQWIHSHQILDNSFQVTQSISLFHLMPTTTCPPPCPAPLTHPSHHLIDQKMAVCRLAWSRLGNGALRAVACGGDGLQHQTKMVKTELGAPPFRQMSWFSGSGERPRRSQSRVLSNDDGHIFLIESERLKLYVFKYYTCWTNQTI